jgi:hypothetical protein
VCADYIRFHRRICYAPPQKIARLFCSTKLCTPMHHSRRRLGAIRRDASSMPLEMLHRAFVLFGRCARLEGAEIAASAGLRILLSGVEPVLARLEFPDHLTTLVVSLSTAPAARLFLALTLTVPTRIPGALASLQRKPGTSIADRREPHSLTPPSGRRKTSQVFADGAAASLRSRYP